jgi:TRAP-type C4-dicarboxylate transport system permease small subunit
VDTLSKALASGARILTCYAALMLLMALVGLVSFEVALRAVTGSGMVWSLDAVGLLLLCFFAVLLPYSWIEDDHVRMDILYVRLPAFLKRLSDLLSALGAMVFTGLIGWHALAGIPYMIDAQVGSSTVSIPHWPFALILGACCAMLFAIVFLGLFAPRKSGH